MKKFKDAKSQWFFAMAVVLAFAIFMVRSATVNEQRALEKAAEDVRVSRQKYEELKATTISDALALETTDPEVGLKKLEGYGNMEGQNLLAARGTLEAALRAKRIAKAKELLASGATKQADDELRAYEAKHEDLEVQNLLAKILAQLWKDRERNERSDLATRKKEGVRIGMTQSQVLQSSWGKPHQVNRTSTSRGDREQWVYSGRDYLYFEDGTLTSIQN